MIGFGIVGMSSFAQPHSTTAIDGPLRNAPRGAGSKIFGAGAGSGLIVWAQGLPAPWNMFVEVISPWLSVGISWGGPKLTEYLIIQARLWGLKRTLSKNQKFADSCKSGSLAHSKATQTIDELQSTIADLIGDEGKIWKR